MDVPFLDFFRLNRESANMLKYVSPYSFIMSPGVCLLKNGALMTSYQVEYPDLESSSPASTAAMASLFNRTTMALAQQ